MATVGKRYAQRTHDKCLTRIIDARTGEMLRAMSLAACHCSAIASTGCEGIAQKFTCLNGVSRKLPHQGSCSERVPFGVLPPRFTMIGSRSLFIPVYFTTPSRFTSDRT